MNFGVPVWSLLPLLVAGMELCGGPAAIGIRYEKLLGFAEEQSAYLASDVLDGNAERFVDYTSSTGFWQTKGDGTWTSGFVPGSFWYLYELTGKPEWADAARHWTEGVRSRATATDNDTGFQVFESFGMGHELDPENREEYAAVMLTGAETLVNQRYNADIGCFRSWDQSISNPTQLPFEVNIDQMMNLELVLWAGQNGGPEEYVDHAIRHADVTWEHNVREDGGTYHVVAYNLDGTVDYKRTHQGWRTESTWSRGQAWATYGYTMVYRYTGLPRMLERARTCYDYFMAETRKDATDSIPYSDFDAPVDNRNPRDTSAAAIVAAAALELFEITGETAFLNDAEAILESLSSPRYTSMGTRYESILRKASATWDRPEVGAIFADFYLLEAMRRWAVADLPPAAVTGNWAGHDVLDGAFVDTGSWLGWLKYSYAPYLYNYILEAWLYGPSDAVGESGGWFYSWRP